MDMLDRLDNRLVQLLGTDAGQSSEDLAKQLKVSAATVRRRLRKLKESEVIRIVALADPDKLGFPMTAVIAFDVAIEKVRLVSEMLAMRPGVKWLLTTTGRLDILALAQFGSTDELYQFTQTHVANAEGVRDSATFICLHVDKGRYMAV